MPPKKEDKIKKQEPKDTKAKKQEPKDDKKGKDKGKKGKQESKVEEAKKEEPKGRGNLQKSKSAEKIDKKRGDDKGKKDKDDPKDKKDNLRGEKDNKKSPRKEEKNPIKGVGLKNSGNKSIEKIPPPKQKNEEDIIKESGLLQAYELFLRAICKHGLPTGDVYEFAAQQIEKYEKKKRAKQLKLKAEMQIRKAARKNEERLRSEEH